MANALNVDCNGGDISIAHPLQQPQDKAQPTKHSGAVCVEIHEGLVAHRSKKEVNPEHRPDQDLSPSASVCERTLDCRKQGATWEVKVSRQKVILHAAWTSS